MKSCETGYKKLMLTMHDIAPPHPLEKGGVAFEEGDIVPPHDKHFRYLKKKEKLKNTLWTGEKKKIRKEEEEQGKSNIRNFLAPTHDVAKRQEVIAFL